MKDSSRAERQRDACNGPCPNLRPDFRSSTGNKRRPVQPEGERAISQEPLPTCTRIAKSSPARCGWNTHTRPRWL